MSNPKDNGGSTHPTKNGSGLSVRDYFAGQALAGICACGFNGDVPSHKNIVSTCYSMADAMIAARGNADE